MLYASQNELIVYALLVMFVSSTNVQLHHVAATYR